MSNNLIAMMPSGAVRRDLLYRLKLRGNFCWRDSTTGRDAELRQRLGRMLAEEAFTIEKVVDQHMRIYQELLVDV